MYVVYGHSSTSSYYLNLPLLYTDGWSEVLALPLKFQRVKGWGEKACPDPETQWEYWCRRKDRKCKTLIPP